MEWKVAPSYQDWEVKRVDEDNKKAYVVTSCPKCGGSGMYVIPPTFSGTCFKCNGNGRIAKWVKAYTPTEMEKYLATQEKAREKRVQKALEKKQALIDNSEENKKEVLAKFGFDVENPKVYIVAGGNTFIIKEELKARGGRYNAAFGWHFTVPTEVPEGYELVAIDVDDVYDWFPQIKRLEVKEFAKDVVNTAKEQIKPRSASEYVGEIKERLRDLRVKVTDRRENPGGFYGTSTLLTFAWGENVLVWFASSYIPEEEVTVGKEYLLTGTVKKHSMYNGIRQTSLSRCILKEI